MRIYHYRQSPHQLRYLYHSYIWSMNESRYPHQTQKDDITQAWQPYYQSRLAHHIHVRYHSALEYQRYCPTDYRYFLQRPFWFCHQSNHESPQGFCGQRSGLRYLDAAMRGQINYKYHHTRSTQQRYYRPLHRWFGSHK